MRCLSLSSAAVLLAASAASAATQTYTIDQAQSSLTITGGSVQVSILTFPVMATAPGSLTAPLAGFIDADLIEGPMTTIELLPSSRIDAVDHDAYLPGSPETPNTPAPGSFAVRFNTVPFTPENVMGVTRGMVVTVNDEPRTITKGEFEADGSLLSIIEGVVDFNVEPTQGDLSTTPANENLTLLPGTLAQDAGVETLTVPLAFQIDLSNELAIITLDFEGVIVATRPLAPACPGDVSGNDAMVNIDDLNAILSVFNTSVGVGSPLDIANDDGVIDIDDLNVVLSNFGVTCG